MPYRIVSVMSSIARQRQPIASPGCPSSGGVCYENIAAIIMVISYVEPSRFFVMVIDMLSRFFFFLIIWVIFPLCAYAENACYLKNSFFCSKWFGVRDGLMIVIDGKKIVWPNDDTKTVCTVIIEREFRSELYSMLSCIDYLVPPISKSSKEVSSIYVLASRPHETWHSPSSRSMRMHIIEHDKTYAACFERDLEAQKKCDFEDFLDNYVERRGSRTHYRSEP